MNIRDEHPSVLPHRNNTRLIAAHRGASRAAPENSLAAVERAIEFGADMVEIDVRRTGDGVLIAHHDPSVGDEPIGELSYDAVADAKGDAPATVEGIVRLAAGRALLDIELKEEGYERDVLDLLDQHVASHEFIVTSFHEPAVAAAKQHGVRAGLLCEAPCAPEDLFAAVERCGADLVAPHIDLVDETVLQGAAERRLPVLVWTVNESSEMKRCLVDPRIAGVITDEPDVAVGVRQDTESPPDPDEYRAAA
jgi:glycerophosphoryl diester phosphodiesterase